MDHHIGSGKAGVGEKAEADGAANLDFPAQGAFQGSAQPLAIRCGADVRGGQRHNHKRSEQGQGQLE